MMWGRFKRLLMCSVLCITLTLEMFTSSTSFADEAEDSKTEEPSGGSGIQKVMRTRMEVTVIQPITRKNYKRS